MTPEQRLAQNLRRARKAAGLSQEALSFAAEVHPTQISLIERGRRMPRVWTLLRLAGGCGVPVGDLLDGIEWRSGVISYGEIVVEKDGGS